MKQLALFDDDAVIGTGRPAPWPTAVEDEPEPVTQNPDQLSFGEDEAEVAA